MNSAVELSRARKLLRGPRALVMGILNITPDSFSDGGEYLEPAKAVTQARQMMEDGADIIDVGGESTRPGAREVSLQEELDRVVPIIEQIASAIETPISVDTYKPEVMAEAVSAGAQMINDINALRAPKALEVAAESDVPVCLMHMLGKPKNMQLAPSYANVVEDVVVFLNTHKSRCLAQGINLDDIIVDPGIGFGKNLDHNLSLLAAVDKLAAETSCRVLIGVSRKSLIDALLSREIGERLPASLGLAVQAVLKGTKIVRVHDVRETVDVIRSVEAVAAATSQNNYN